MNTPHPTVSDRQKYIFEKKKEDYFERKTYDQAFILKFKNINFHLKR